MPPQETSSPEPVRTQLKKVLSSRGFARNDRLSGFLRFVVEQELSGRGDELKESVIGVELFRPPARLRRPAGFGGAERGRQIAVPPCGILCRRGSRGRVNHRAAQRGYKPAFRQIEKATAPVPGPAASRRRVWIWLAVALAGCAMVLAVLWWQGILHRNEPIPIAVLPLINLDRNPDHDYFADGLTGEIIRNLSIIDGLAVRSQTSSFAFKGKPQNVHDVGKQLDAEYILEGSVLLSGQQLRINAQLVRVRDDYPLWSGKYDRELTDVFAIQDEISRGIVNGLRLETRPAAAGDMRPARKRMISTFAPGPYRFSTASPGSTKASVPWRKRSPKTPRSLPLTQAWPWPTRPGRVSSGWISQTRYGN